MSTTLFDHLATKAFYKYAVVQANPNFREEKVSSKLKYKGKKVHLGISSEFQGSMVIVILTVPAIVV